MASDAPCPGCLVGDHQRHITSWKPAPPGAIGGMICRCFGACQRNTGVIVGADAEVRRLHALFKRWDVGALTTVEMSILIQRIATKLKSSCFCDEGVCCEIHDTHTRPHRHCILR